MLNKIKLVLASVENDLLKDIIDVNSVDSMLTKYNEYKLNINKDIPELIRTSIINNANIPKLHASINLYIEYILKIQILTYVKSNINTNIDISIKESMYAIIYLLVRVINKHEYNEFTVLSNIEYLFNVMLSGTQQTDKDRLCCYTVKLLLYNIKLLD